MTVDERPVPGGLPIWEIPGWRERHGVVAGITGKGNGFDMGLRGGGPVGEVLDRWMRLAEEFPGCDALVTARQVHGTGIAVHGSDPGRGIHLVPDADGHLTARRGLLLTVTVADCVPVYLVAPAHGAIGLLHAGWRGTAGGILPKAVAMLEEFHGVPPSALQVHLGTAISGPAYEVGREVMEGLGLAAEGSGPWHADIRAVLRRQAVAAGVGEVSVSGHCTFRQSDRFFSHRASGGRDGRMVAFLGFAGSR